MNPKKLPLVMALIVLLGGLWPASAAADEPTPAVQQVALVPEATVLAPGLRPTLTMSAHLTVLSTGEPIPGRRLVFKVFGTEPGGMFDLGGGVVVCEAVTDATGFATCAGGGLLGSALSVLAGRSYVVHFPDGSAPYGFGSATAPVVQLG